MAPAAGQGGKAGSALSDRTKALGLISGGMDSTLAAKMLVDQGVDVELVHFNTGFCKVDQRRVMKRRSDAADPARLRNEALRAGADLDVPVEIVDVADEYLERVVLRPRHGYGSAFNPCVDCRIFMLKKAREIADERGSDVVFTGEVLGQRPMSQYKAALNTIEDESGLAGRLLRPLSAQRLEPTRAERAGRVDRERLGGVVGRSRKSQLAMAREAGLDLPTPSGGCCYLADPAFGRRMRDLLRHREARTIGRDELPWLKVGRHFRLAPRAKAIAARDEAESTWVRAAAGDRWSAQVADGAGSVVVLDGEASDERLDDLARLAARYSRERTRKRVEIRLRRGDEERQVEADPADDGWLDKRRI